MGLSLEEVKKQADKCVRHFVDNMHHICMDGGIPVLLFYTFWKLTKEVSAFLWTTAIENMKDRFRTNPKV